MSNDTLTEQEISMLTYKRARRKADQHWDMAGLARQDGDRTEEVRHTKLAREYEHWARELRP